MDYLSRFVSSAHRYYKNINVANLTGAIDVIVVENEYGEYQSTPFYVRFGKLGVLFPKSNTVEICVNGIPITDVCMRVGSTGYAFFDNQMKNRSSTQSESQTSTNNFRDSVDSNVSTSNEFLEKFKTMKQVDKTFEINHQNQKIFSRANSDSGLLEKVSQGTNNLSLTKEINDSIVIQPPSFQAFTNYLQNIYWPNEFYIYQFDQSKNTSTMKCHLLFPEDFLKLPVQNNSYDHLWIIWSGICVTARTAAIYLLKNIDEQKKELLQEHDSQLPEYGSVILEHKRNRGSEISPRSSFQLPSNIHSAKEKCDQSKNKYGWLERFHDNCRSLDLDANNKRFEKKSNFNLSVQSVLPPIKLDVASLIVSPEDTEQEQIQTNQNSSVSTSDLLKVEIPTSADKASSFHSSNNDIRFQSKPTQISSPEETGYFSDETEHHSTSSFRRSRKFERRMSGFETKHLTSEQLHKLNLHSGPNEAIFSVISKYQGTCQCACFIYLWKWSDKIVISDIDGTITKSDWLGQFMPILGMDWTHSLVAQLYGQIALNGYRFIYLTSRPIGQARNTRKFLHTVQQNNHHLPDGPILLSPFSVMEAFHKEIILRKPEEYKISCLKEVYNLFVRDDLVNIHGSTHSPFVAGFGNRPTDVATYKAIGLKDHQIFTVNYSGDIICGEPKLNNNNSNLKNKQNTQINQDNTIINTKLNNSDSSETKTNMNTTHGNSLSAKLNFDRLLKMIDFYFPQTKDRLIYAENYSDYTYWKEHIRKND